VAATEQLGSVGGRSGGRLRGPDTRLADDPDTVEEAKAHPEVFAGKSIGQVAITSRPSSAGWMKPALSVTRSAGY
jgi:hypothetical protein